MLCVASLLALASCASKPRNIDNACAVFDQNDGWIGNWRRAVGASESRHGVPAHVLMATVRMESGFQSNARPPRRTLFGFIPWKRQSTAYGYSQALDGTWADYRRETGSIGARRANFADAIDFVGWYHARSVRTLGIPSHDAYRLYLAYYSGHAGYRRGSYRTNQSIQNYARRTAQMADRYATQMANCR